MPSPVSATRVTGFRIFARANSSGEPESWSNSRHAPAATSACAGQGGVWYPDLSKYQTTLGGGILVKF
jgi:hypothetical protein